MNIKKYQKQTGLVEQMNARFRDGVNRKGKNFNFKKDMIDAVLGEEATEKYLQDVYGKDNVQDVRNFKAYQNADVDYVAYDNEARKMVNYEVKTDFQANNTGNVAYELTSNGNPGCLGRSAADYVAYITFATEQNPNTHFYMINLPEWRKLISNSNKDSKWIFRWNAPMEEGAVGHLFRIEGLLSEGVARQVY